MKEHPRQRKLGGLKFQDRLSLFGANNIPNYDLFVDKGTDKPIGDGTSFL